MEYHTTWYSIELRLLGAYNMKSKFLFWVIVYIGILLVGLISDWHIVGICKFILSLLGIFMTIYALALSSIAGKTLKRYAHQESNSGFVPDRFTSFGIYSCMRHPMHLGIGLLPLGIALMFGNIAAILAGGWVLAAAFWFVLTIEEPETMSLYKDSYIEYMQKVPAFNFSLKCVESGLYALKQKELSQENSKVEVTGFEARYYDKLMNLITFGWYSKFIKKAIDDIGLTKSAKVADFGAGTGSNALLMHPYIGKDGEIVGFEIGKEMQEQFLENTKGYKNIILADKSILEPLNEEEKYDFVFISFVLHGFTKENREKIIQNACKILKKGGAFVILDYNEFDVDKAPFIYRFGIRFLECPLAEEFINTNIEEILNKEGFGDFSAKTYQKGHIRLLKAVKS